MKNPLKLVSRLGSFLREVAEETSKSTWPQRGELWQSTIVVIVSVLGLSVFIGLCDWLLVRMVRAILPLG